MKLSIAIGGTEPIP